MDPFNVTGQLKSVQEYILDNADYFRAKFGAWYDLASRYPYFLTYPHGKYTEPATCPECHQAIEYSGAG